MRTDVVSVELVDTNKGSYGRSTEGPFDDRPKGREFAWVEVIDDGGVKLEYTWKARSCQLKQPRCGEKQDKKERKQYTNVPPYDYA